MERKGNILLEVLVMDETRILLKNLLKNHMYFGESQKGKGILWKRTIEGFKNVKLVPKKWRLILLLECLIGQNNN
jgi:hypothetical protein